MRLLPILAVLSCILQLTQLPASAGSCTDWGETLAPPGTMPDVTGSVCAMADEYVYIAGEQLQILEMDNEGPSAVIGTVGLSETAHVELILMGDRIYTLTGDTSVTEIDIGDPSAPVVLRTYISDVRLLDIARLQSTIITLDADSRLHVIDIGGEAPLSASIVTIPDTRIDEIEAQGNIMATLGVPCGIYDMSEPTSPAKLDEIDPLYLPCDLLYVGDRLYYHDHTPDGSYLLCSQILPDGSVNGISSIGVRSSYFASGILCADDRFLFRSYISLCIYNSTGLETDFETGSGYFNCTDIYESDLQIHNNILCAVNPRKGLSFWRIPESLAVQPVMSYDAHGDGHGNGQHWIVKKVKTSTYDAGGLYEASYRADVSIFDISEVLTPSLIAEHSVHLGCDWEGCSPGYLKCHLSATHWAIYTSCAEGYCSWQPFDLITGTFVESGHINGGVVYANGDIIWCVDVWEDTIEKYELSVEHGAERLYGFESIPLDTGSLHWLDENRFIHVSPTAKIYDLSDPDSFIISTDWPADVPMDVTFIEVRDNILYMRSETTLYAIDVTDPMTPTYHDELTLGTWLASTSASDILPVIVDDGAYLVHLDPDGGFAACSAMIEGDFERILPVDDLAYCHDGYATLLYDLSDPANPAYIGTGTGGTGGLMLKDGYLIDNAGVYLPHCSTTTPTCLQTFDAIRDGTRVNLTAALYGDLDGELVLRRETAGTDPVELARQPLPADGRASWTDPTPPSSAINYLLELDGARLGTAAVPAAEPPRVTRLLPNLPNPFNPKTTLRYEMSLPGHAELTLYDARGRRVVTLLDEDLPAGAGMVDWDGRDAKGRLMPSGSYLAAFETDEGTTHRKMMLAR